MSDTPTTSPAEMAARAIGQAVITGQSPGEQMGGIPPSQTPAPAAVVDPAATPPEGDMVPRTMVEQARQEAANYRTRAQALAALDQSTYDAVRPLLEAAASGDRDTIAQWIAAQYDYFYGDEAGTSPAAAPGVPAPGAAPAEWQPTPEAIQALVQQKLEEQAESWRQEQIRQDAVGRMNADFQSVGIDPATPLARAVASYGQALTQAEGRPVFIPEAFERFRADFGGGAPAAPVAPQVPSAAPAPAGVPASHDPNINMKPHERALARLRSGG